MPNKKSIFEMVQRSATELLTADAITVEQYQKLVKCCDNQPPLIRQLIELGNGLNGQPVRGNDRTEIQQRLRDIIAGQRGKKDEL